VDAEGARRVDRSERADLGAEIPVLWSHRLTEWHWVLADAILASLIGAASLAAVFVASQSEKLHQLRTGPWDIVRVIAIVAACAAMPWRRLRPKAVLATTTAAVALLIIIGFRGPVLIIAPIAVYTVAAASTDRRASLIALALVAGALGLSALVAVGGPMFGSAVSGLALALAGWLAGDNRRARRAYAQGVAERAAEREREREERIRRAAADERMRIARELHDVVAHAMSVIAVRSGVARAVLNTRPEEAGAALRIIEETSRQALSEMRHLVGVLRQPEEADLGPAPGLDDLSRLLDQVAQAGVAVTVHREGEARPLPAGVELSAYRIIQEGLTNVGRHAGPGPASLEIRYRPAELEIEITNPLPNRPATPGRPTSNGGGGHGLIGMRERATLYGGELTAGPTGPPNEFRVLARIPTNQAANA
jgi:signal transduction histidine kinase